MNQELDLEIVKGCAKALGKELYPVQGLIGSYYEISGGGSYWPLTVKEQALDLALALRLQMTPQDIIIGEDNKKVPGWRVSAKNSVAPHFNEDLLRAICECAAELNGVQI